jgi:hypothetical protein
VAENLDQVGIAKYAEEKSLFNIQASGNQQKSLSKRLVEPVGALSDSIRQFSKGELDLPGMAFLALLGVGIYQIARGNLRAPPWYTAFWYAMGIFTKSIVDNKNGDNS